jgi:flagellar hook-associated protein FlgK
MFEQYYQTEYQRDVNAEYVEKEKRTYHRRFAIPHHLHVAYQQISRYQGNGNEIATIERIQDLFIFFISRDRNGESVEHQSCAQYCKENEFLP